MNGYLLLLVAFFAAAFADEAVDAVVEESSKRIPYETPKLVNEKSVLFWETFQGKDLESLGWIFSKHEDYTKQDPIIQELESAFEGDTALLLNKKHARYGLSKKLDSPISLESVDNIIVQFEARAHSKLSCSGAYLKFVAESEDTKDQSAFSEKTPYVVMFGPDKCGNNQKLHAILRHQNPKSGEFSEIFLKDTQKPPNDEFSHIYTLQMSKADQSVKVSVDLVEKVTGKALEGTDFDPPFFPREEIPDPDDKKPEDWVDEAKIPDPEATKPTDWVDVKQIQDPESKKPDDWDDEEDGEWEPAMIDNPEYKGEWRAPLIDNPEYKGEWKPRMIKNPAFFTQEFPLNTLPKITHVFVEVLSNDDDISFDNILITTDVETARFVAENHSMKKQELEKEIAQTEEAIKRKEERENRLKDDFGVSSVMNYLSGEFQDLYNDYPAPVVAGFTLVGILFFYFFLWKPTASKKQETTEAVEEREDEDEEESEEGETEETQEKTESPKKKSSVRRRPRRAE